MTVQEIYKTFREGYIACLDILSVSKVPEFNYYAHLFNAATRIYQSEESPSGKNSLEERIELIKKQLHRDGIISSYTKHHGSRLSAQDSILNRNILRLTFITDLSSRSSTTALALGCVAGILTQATSCFLPALCSIAYNEYVLRRKDPEDTLDEYLTIIAEELAAMQQQSDNAI